MCSMVDYIFISNSIAKKRGFGLQYSIKNWTAGAQKQDEYKKRPMAASDCPKLGENEMETASLQILRPEVAGFKEILQEDCGGEKIPTSV